MTSNNPPSSLWQVDSAGPEHALEIQKLFKSVFKQDMTPAQWDWKYGNKRGVGVIVRNGDEIVAYYGGMERRTLLKSEAVCAVQCGDSMVAESHRGTLSKRGPFYLSATSFLDKYVGINRPYLLSYGFPNARAMRLAERLGIYAEVGTVVEVAWSAASSSAFRAEVFDYDSPDHAQCVEQLWSKMAAEFADRTIGIRDLEYLRYRYHEHPELSYDLHLVYRIADGGLIGLLVTRQIDDRLLLVDMVSAKGNMRDLAEFGRILTAEANCREFYGWLTDVDCPLFADSSVEIRESAVRLPISVFCEGLTAEEMQDSWFFMCGDSDFM